MKRSQGFLIVIALLVVLAVGLVLLAVRAAAADSAGPVAAAPATSGAPAWLAALACDVAAVNGDEEPSSATWTLTVLRDAEYLVGGDIPFAEADQKRYIVLLEGDFLATMAFTPSTAPAPQGNRLVLVVDPETRSVRCVCLWPADLKMNESRLPALAPLSLR
jgi:hypothetical protein